VNTPIEKILKYIDNTENFLNGNVPDFINQFLNFEIYYYLYNMLIIILLLFPIILISKRIIKMRDLGIFSIREAKVYRTILWSIWLFTFTTTGIFAGNAILKIKTAPKVYVLDYLKNKRGR